MANLSFNIELSSNIDTNRTLVSNIGRAIVKRLAVKFEGNEILSVDDFDIFACYRDLWKTKSEKRNTIQQGIVSRGGCTNNCIKLRIKAGDKNAGVAQDNAIATTYRNKFIIPLDFEMLDSATPYYQAGLRNRLCYEITFSDYNQVINPQYHQKFQMQSIRSQTYPENMRTLLNPTSRDLSGLNTSIWPCCMTEFSDFSK